MSAWRASVAFSLVTVICDSKRMHHQKRTSKREGAFVSATFNMLMDLFHMIHPRSLQDESRRVLTLKTRINSYIDMFTWQSQQKIRKLSTIFGFGSNATRWGWGGGLYRPSVTGSCLLIKASPIYFRTCLRNFSFLPPLHQPCYVTEHKNLAVSSSSQ